jgi:hypothetical protein
VFAIRWPCLSAPLLDRFRSSTRGGWRQFGKQPIERFEIGTLQPVELGRRLVKFREQLGTRFFTAARQHHQLDAFVMHHRLSMRKAELLEAIDDPRGIRRIAAPFVGQRPHRPAGAWIEAEQGA